MDSPTSKHRGRRKSRVGRGKGRRRSRWDSHGPYVRARALLVFLVTVPGDLIQYFFVDRAVPTLSSV